MAQPSLSEKQQGYAEQFDVEGLNFFRRLLVAIQNKEFLVYFQPKVSISDRRIAGAEALVRWMCDGQILPPVKFIPFCERTGLVIDIDFYVLEETCRKMREWMDKGIELVRISVNFSKYHFNEAGVAEKIYGVIEKYHIPTEYIEVEFTETAYLDKEEILEYTVDKLRSYGIKSSIDDFGSGYSSLNLLQNMDFEVVKLDKSLLGKGVENQKAKKVISSIIHMAKELEMEVLAEGVETPEEYNLLKDLNCDIVQGFLFDKPLPESDFERRLRKRVYPPDFKWDDSERSRMELKDNTERLQQLVNKENTSKEREALAKEYFSTNRYMPSEPEYGKKSHVGALVVGVLLTLIALTALFVIVMTSKKGASVKEEKSEEITYTQSQVDEIVSEEVTKAKEEERKAIDADYSKKLREAAEVAGGMANFIRSFFPDDLIFYDGYRFNFVPIDRSLKQNTVEAARFVKDENTGFMYYTDENGNRTSSIGIDVSSFQGDVDWEKVAASDVEFALIRSGFRGYGSEGKLVEDKSFQKNMDGAIKAGLHVGSYFYTQALTTEEAEEEAAFAIDLLKGYSFDGPVILDVEAASSEERIKDITKEQRTDNIIAFCEKISEAGYTPMIYADIKYFSMKMDISRLEKYEKWYANYNDHEVNTEESVWAYNNPFMFPYEFKIWQYSNQGALDGVNTTVDFNVLFSKWW